MPIIISNNIIFEQNCISHGLKYIKYAHRSDGIIMDTMFIWVLKWICSTKRNINTECIE